MDIGESLSHKAGPLPVWVWGLLIGGGVVAWMWFNPGGSTSDGATDVAPSLDDPYAGMDDALAYDGNNANDVKDSPADTVGQVFSNAEWFAKAAAFLVGKGHNPLKVQKALMKYLAGQKLTKAQQALVAVALANVGYPPIVPVVQNAGSGSGDGNGNGGNGGGGSGGGSGGGPGGSGSGSGSGGSGGGGHNGTDSTPGVSNRVEWGRAAKGALRRAGHDDARVQKAIDRYLAGKPLTANQQALVAEAIKRVGKPPKDKSSAAVSRAVGGVVLGGSARVSSDPQPTGGSYSSVSPSSLPPLTTTTSVPVVSIKTSGPLIDPKV